MDSVYEPPSPDQNRISAPTVDLDFENAVSELEPNGREFLPVHSYNFLTAGKSY
jgi:hypothetical protein